MQPCLSSQLFLVADENLTIVRAVESACTAPSRHVRSTVLDDLRNGYLPDSIPGLDPAEASDACRAILSGERFPDGSVAYRRAMVVCEPEPERRVIVLSPGSDGGVRCRVSRTFLRHPQADALSARDYQAMVESSAEFMFMIDQLGFHTYISPMIRTTMGADPDSVYGMHMSEIVHPDDLERCQSIMEGLTENGAVCDVDYRLTLPDGSTRHIAVNGTCLEAANGTRFMGIAKDVTETMNLRAQLQARQDALAALSSIVLDLSRPADISKALGAALEGVLSFLGLTPGGIFAISADGSEFLASAVVGADLPPIPPSRVLACLNALCPSDSPSIQIVTDSRTDARVDAVRAEVEAAGVESFVMVRLHSTLGHHACMGVVAPQGGELSVEQREFLELATGILGSALDNAVLQGEVADRADRLAMLERMALSINSGIDVRSIFTACQTALRQLTDCDETCLVIFGANEVSEIYSFSDGGDLVYSQEKLSPRQIEEFSAIHDAHSWIHFGDMQEFRMQHERRPLCSGSIAVAPLMNNGSVTGLLKIWARRDSATGPRVVSILQAVAEHLAIAVANARLFEAEHARTLELEALGREMQHRIKNNLQSVAGLLSMSRSSGESERALDRCLDQVRAISTVHSLLTPKRVVAGIRLKRLMREVAGAALAASGRSERIAITVGGDNCRLSPDTAVALGVIANELVSNAIEHGFAGRDAGEITISSALEPACMAVEISDDGSGLPPDFAFDGKARTGLGLVSSLVEHGLHGRFAISRSGNGTTARIEF